MTSSRSEVTNIITDVFTDMLHAEQGWVELPQGLGLGTSWNLLWSWSRPRVDMDSLMVWQKVNHFVDSRQLTRKDFLKKNVQRFVLSSLSCGGSGDTTTDASVRFFDIMPKTFILPAE